MESVTKIRVFLADGNLLVLEGLRKILESDGEINVVGMARNWQETTSQASRLAPDVIVMDLEIPGMDGVGVTQELKQQLPNAKVLIISSSDDMVREAIEAGASGYLTKYCEKTEITSAVHQVHNGLCPIAPSITRKLVNDYIELKRNRASTMLTEREIDILRLIADGKKSDEIGSHLFVSLSTVKREVSQIFDKLGVNDRPHAVSEAMKRRLI